MSNPDHELLERLSRCSIQSGTFDKRFVRQTCVYVKQRPLTVREVETIHNLSHRYRRQLGACGKPDCPDCKTPGTHAQLELGK